METRNARATAAPAADTQTGARILAARRPFECRL